MIEQAFHIYILIVELHRKPTGCTGIQKLLISHSFPPRDSPCAHFDCAKQNKNFHSLCAEDIARIILFQSRVVTTRNCVKNEKFLSVHRQLSVNDGARSR